MTILNWDRAAAVLLCWALQATVQPRDGILSGQEQRALEDMWPCFRSWEAATLYRDERPGVRIKWIERDAKPR